MKIGFLERRKFRDLVRRQIALFQTDHVELITRAREARRQYARTADPNEAHEHYITHDDLSEDVEEHLYDMCERYAANIDPARVDYYIAEFNRQAWRQFRDLIPRLHFDPDRR